MQIEVEVPNGVKGDWEVSTFEVTEQQADLHNLRASMHGGSRRIQVGIYKKLSHQGFVVMSNTPTEVADHSHFIRKAKNTGGRILINGLGLGVALTEILTSSKVESVTIIELSPDVISLVKDTYKSDTRVTIIEANALTWKPPKGVRYNAVWHDIWNNICGDNLSEMTTLHRKYGRRTDWQDSWCKQECLRARR